MSNRSALNFSTIEVCRKLGIHRATLLRWLQSGKLPEPRHVVAGLQDVRIWSERDLARAHKLQEQMHRLRRAA